ncbi:flagellar biosynthesis protein FlhA [Rhodopila sp.]|jgi:flagellar biosynthesis protein FlhA|uniref:flagellar biosynthesis protein FlhA n=1 Tax=Rhodopila sp. TaxID=2480087 RepID=UPI002BF27189|nr:flagellar biosynthesis protein FlhA [Rhodopila sp.]HVZ08660.1 flagellar biosynthesis protein FlhA [Rhodopila sp.]
MQALAPMLGWLRQRTPGGDVSLACGVLLLLCILILPMPTFLLDIGLAFSFMTAVLMLVVAIFLQRPLDFSSFPTMLLLTTLLRLSLNVATARLILSHGAEGPYAAGHVIAAFGSFLMGDDVTIGGVMFIMLLIVNFIVITKGSSRIAEVSARFFLDAMPGKQMAIDADLSSGAIDDKTARKRRADLDAEASFYGAMDGAAKFVRGDAVAAIVITTINIIGGLIIGLVRAHMSLADSVAAFTTLTVGDGLASQIPSLLVATAAGIVVAKGSAEGGMSSLVLRQVTLKPTPLSITAGAGAVLALMPGLPTLPFLGVAGLAAGGAFLRSRQIEAQDAAPTPPPAAGEPNGRALVAIDMVRVELGYGLLSLASGDGPKLSDRIRNMRRSMAQELGFVLPSVRIQDNVDLEPYEYRIYVKDIIAGKGELRPAMMLAVSTDDGQLDLPGERTVEPTFGLPAWWIDATAADDARARGCTVVDAASVLTTHLTQVLKENVAELLSHAELDKLLQQLPSEHQRLVSDLIPGTISMGNVQRVLQILLAEHVSIRDLPTILEAIQEACGMVSKGIISIAGHVRSRLARQITDRYVGPNGYVPIISLSAEWEDTFAESLVGPPDDRQLALPQGKLHAFIERTRAAIDEAMQAGEQPVILTSAGIRYHIHAVVDRIRMNVPVLAQTEIHRRARVKVVAVI